MTSDASIEPPGSEQDAARCFAVVATLGQRDEEAAWAASRLQPAYLGVVASRKRFGHIRDTLTARGATPDQLDRIANPAGLDIGAETPEEIALSILAEITRRARARQPARAPVPAAAVTDTGRNPAPATVVTDTERDPVCGMSVAVGAATHQADAGGRTYYFCGAHCRDRFLAEPHTYAAAAVQEG